MRVLDLFSGYRVSDTGRVWNKRGREVAQQRSREGYMRVELWSGGKGKKHLVHRLVASVFVENTDGKPCVNHIDGDKANNCAENLEWVTQSENQLHAYRSGLQRPYKKPTPLSAAHKAALCGSRWRGERRAYIAAGKRYDSPEAAAEAHGVSRQTVYNRAASPRFPDWRIDVWREVKQCLGTNHESA